MSMIINDDGNAGTQEAEGQLLMMTIEDGKPVIYFHGATAKPHISDIVFLPNNDDFPGDHNDRKPQVKGIFKRHHDGEMLHTKGVIFEGSDEQISKIMDKLSTLLPSPLIF